MEVDIFNGSFRLVRTDQLFYLKRMDKGQHEAGDQVLGDVDVLHSNCQATPASPFHSRAGFRGIVKGDLQGVSVNHQNQDRINPA